ncbi:MAG: hypothetical protein J6V12_07625 [Bacteroidaceae bacterium]|nr:hypothetical protein [Bacteroidaceae bacterium]
MEKNDNTRMMCEDSQEQVQQRPARGKFQGFSVGFLLILLALVVGIYVVCTVMAV